jgi:hypothetical protein
VARRSVDRRQTPPPPAPEPAGASPTINYDRRASDRRGDDLGPPAGAPERRRQLRRASDVPKPPCPFCRSSTSSVTRSRAPYLTRFDDEKYHRIRQCAGCGEFFDTCEELNREAFARRLAARGLTLADVGVERRKAEDR